MKKLMVVLTAAMVAVGAQAAVMNWGAGVLADTTGNATFPGYANTGTDVFLLYNGIGGTDPVTEVFKDALGDLQIVGGQVVNSYVTTYGDYVAGGFLTQEAVPDTAWPFGDESGSWDAMNNKVFTMIAISEGGAGDFYGLATGNAVLFSNGTGINSIGEFSAAVLDAGSTVLVTVPEPATIGLMGIAGLGMFLARKKVRA